MSDFQIFVLIFAVLFIVIDLIQKILIKRFFWARKATHILSGIPCFFLPDYLTVNEIVALGLLFAIILGISKWKKILSLHEVSRKTLGEILYPISLAILALLILPGHVQTFKLAVLVLSLSDGFAEIFGEKLNLLKFRIFGSTKSLGGSLVCFIITFVLFLIFSHSKQPKIGLCLVAAIIITLTELSLTFGFDNLAIPLVTAGVHVYLFA